MSPGSFNHIGLSAVHKFIMVCLASLVLIGLAPEAANSSLEGILADNAKLIIKSSSKTVEPVLEQFTRNGGTGVEQFLNNWQAKKLYFIKEH